MVKPQGTNGWIGVDFDGTLAFYETWTKWDEFGPPIPKMVARIHEWWKEGYDVRIVTARVGLDDKAKSKCKLSGEEFDNQMMRYAIATWCEKHLGRRMRVQCHKDFHMIELWDDRAVGVVANTGETLVDAAVAEATARRGKAFSGIASGEDGEAD